MEARLERVSVRLFLHNGACWRTGAAFLNKQCEILIGSLRRKYYEDDKGRWELNWLRRLPSPSRSFIHPLWRQGGKYRMNINGMAGLYENIIRVRLQLGRDRDRIHHRRRRRFVCLQIRGSSQIKHVRIVISCSCTRCTYKSGRIPHDIQTGASNKGTGWQINISR